MSNISSPIIIVEQVQGGSKGQLVNTETQLILNRLLNIPIQRIQTECRVADLRRDIWETRDQNAFMIEEGLANLTYHQGIRELEPSFLLNLPSTIRINFLDAYIEQLNPIYSSNHDAAAGVQPDPVNPILYVFLPTLEVNGQIIRWTNYRETFQQVIIHEFLHLCSDVPNLRQGVVDGRVRHNIIGINAVEPILS